MKVFKFGGASVKDADAVRNVASIVKRYSEKLGIVVSAMGKTTNALEEIVDARWRRDENRYLSLIEERRNFHHEIISELFADSNPVRNEVDTIFQSMTERYAVKLTDNYDYEYDQIVSLGEVLATKIVTAFLNEVGCNAQWTDARELIRTDHKYREATVNWERTKILFKEEFMPLFKQADVLVLQGFIGHTEEGFTTTLGREGSDYSAAIMAYCCDAEDVTIWKDVPGMLNADPKWFDNTILLKQISFKEAIELSYYGASVIHPKTVKPLQNKGIPLYVKSFIHPLEPGTVIQAETGNDHLVPSFIFKMDQVLFSFTPRDFSFIAEENLSDIFNKLAQLNAKINVMQNSALNFSVLLDENKTNTDHVLQVFGENYRVKYNQGLELITIRHYDQATIDRVTQDKEVLLEQKTRETARLIVKNRT